MPLCHHAHPPSARAQVSFVDRTSVDSGLFIANRVVDCLFGFDVLVNFNLAYFDTDLGWVTRRSLIAKNYLQGFAIVDIASTVPYDVIVDGQTGSLRRLKALRLIKLLRIVRSARVISRLADQFAIHYSYLTLFNFGVSTMLLAHWMAWRAPPRDERTARNGAPLSCRGSRGVRKHGCRFQPLLLTPRVPLCCPHAASTAASSTWFRRCRALTATTRRVTI